MPKHSKAKQYRYESESEDEDLEGGALGALLSGLLRFGTTAARAAPRAVTTVARTGPNVIGKVPTTASRFVSTPLRTAARVGSRFAMPALNVAGIGLGVGLPIYQALDYEEQKKLYAEDAQRVANENAQAQSQAYFTAQDVETQKYLAGIEEQRAAYAKEAKELEDMRLKEQKDYAKYIEEQNAMAARDAEDYQTALAQQQRYMEEQIKAEVERLSQMYASKFTAPPKPAPAPAPPKPAPAPPKPAPAPPKPAPAPAPAQPAKTVGLQRRGTVRGQGVKVDKRKIRAEIVKRVMKEKGFKKLAEASKYVKEHNLYKG